MIDDARSSSYRQTIRDLSDRLVSAQRPIRVLAAINWDESIKRQFFEDDFKKQPRVDRAYYESRDLRLDPNVTRDELRHIEAEVSSRLGPTSSAGALIRFMAQQFALTVDMIEARGPSDSVRCRGFSTERHLMCSMRVVPRSLILP
jgi:hypothetical protein